MTKQKKERPLVVNLNEKVVTNIESALTMEAQTKQIAQKAMSEYQKAEYERSRLIESILMMSSDVEDFSGYEIVFNKEEKSLTVTKKEDK